MRNIIIELEYDGTRYDGFSRQKGKTKSNSIEDKLVGVISKLDEVPEEEVMLTPAVRTDAGAHAYCQVVNFKTDTKLSLVEIEQYFNRYLPKDIAVLKAKEADERFNASFASKAVEFEYKLTCGEVPSVFERRFNFYSFKRLDVKRMKEACGYLKGKHDFKGFSDNRKQKKATLREVFEASVYGQGDEISVRIKVDDCWPGMIRIIVGTLVEIGKGEKKPEIMKEILESGKRELAGEAIEPKGLFLSSITY